MLERPIGGGETMMMPGMAPQKFEARPPNPNSFTPLEGKKFYDHVHPPVFEQPTTMESPKFVEPDIASSGGYSPPTDTEIPKELRKLLADMQASGKNSEVVPEIKDKQLSEEHFVQQEITPEQKNFLMRVLDTIKKFLPWNWGKSDVSQFADQLKQKDIIPKA